MELPLPALPDTLRAPEARAAFMALHFWDALDFSRDPRAVDTLFMEQNFANYLTVLQVTAPDGVEAAVDALLCNSRRSQPAAGVVDFVADKYLYDPNSPMRDEELYLPFLHYLERDTTLTEAQREKATWQISKILKNRRGFVATDFSFTTSDGAKTTLLKQLGADLTILMLYDPDCEQCREISGQFIAAPLPAGVKVIAIDVSEQRAAHQRNDLPFPATWTMGIASPEFEEAEPYEVRALPTFYLFDGSATIVLKDPPLSTLLNFLAQ